MLSTAKIRTGSWRYYANQVGRGACEYFLGVGEAPGRWYGRGLDGLGLDANARVAERELEAMFGRALHPTALVRLGRAWRADGVTGYDLCFSAPKSVSALWALSEDPDLALVIRKAHMAAVRAGLDYLDTHAGYSRTGHNGDTQVATDGLAAAVFDHRTSRAGDPQLHTHALVLNKVQCGDGEWRTVDGHEIYAHKKSAGVIYQAALRNELSRRLGVTWTAVSKDGQAEIAGVPTTLAKRWSTRADQVAAAAAPVIARYEHTLGRPLTSAERTAVGKVAVLESRPDKETVDILTLTDRWLNEAAGLGWTPDRLLASVSSQAAPAAGADQARTQIEQVVVDAVVAAGDRKAVFTRSDLAVEVASHLPVLGVSAELTRELVERVTDRALETSETVRLMDDRDGPVRASDARYASATTLTRELSILTFADRGRRAGVALCQNATVRGVCVGTGLDYAQLNAVAELCRRGDQVSVLVAPAGTGKTTTLAAAVTAWRADGIPVFGLAPSARAAKELAAATGLPADTVAKYLHEQQGWPINPSYQLPAGAVVIVDEASMLSTVDLHALAGDVQAVGGKLLLVGDPAQIGAIDAAGGMLPALADRLGAASLTEVHRFRNPWERAASLQLRAGDPAAIDAYLHHDRIHPIDPDSDPYEPVLTDYQQLTTTGGRVLLLARTHDDVDALNHRARQHALTTGEVRGEPLIVDGDRDWRIGDRLRVTRNDRRIPVGADHLRNGDTFTVTGRTDTGLTVQRLDSPETAVLHYDYLSEHATYGWASTIDSAQGATVDHTLLLARPGLDRTRLYVGLTRGRDTNHLYLAPAPDPEISPRHQPRPGLDPGRQVQTMLATFNETAAAHTRLPNPPAAIQPPPGIDIEPTAPRPPTRTGHDRSYQWLIDRGRDQGNGRER